MENSDTKLLLQQYTVLKNYTPKVECVCSIYQIHIGEMMKGNIYHKILTVVVSGLSDLGSLIIVH